MTQADHGEKVEKEHAAQTDFLSKINDGSANILSILANMPAE
jgi:hypothetical protein